MLFFVAALIAATFASGAWCIGDIVPERTRRWWQAGRRLRASALLLVAALGLAAALRFLLVPAHHAMYIDEPWYAEAACNLARLGRLVVCHETWDGPSCTPYEKALGWPVFLAPWTALGGCDPALGIAINRVLGTATVLLAALAARCAGAKWWQSVIAASLLAIHPVHVAWSATGETNVSAAAALLAGLFGALLYVRTGRGCGAALAIAGLGLATAIRPESFIPAAVCAVILALAAPPARARRLRISAAIGLVCAAAAAAALPLWAMNETISGGAFLSPANVPPAVRLLAGSPSLAAHAAVLSLALGGALLLARSRPRRAAPWLLLGTGLAGALVALGYERFHERMLLGATVALLPLTAFVFAWGAPGATRRRWHRIAGPLAGTLCVGLLAWLWWPALRQLSVPPETQMLETRIAARVGRLPLPADALLIAEQPPVVAAAGVQHVMASRDALANAERLRRELSDGRPVYFLCDMFCEPEFHPGDAAPPCEQMLAQFALAPVVEERLNTRAYGLYRVTGLAPAGPRPGCPRLP